MKKTKYKVKKAANGLQDIAVPEQGSYSNIASSAISMAGSGSSIGGPWGALAGGVLGLGAGILQKNSQDKANKLATMTNQQNKMNRAYQGVDSSINQAPQRFSKGGKVKTKTIEIEGKKTPEIHTDKNFNVKNLGTTPHSKGGNKVEAEEGDIVFNTQNSVAKYNKVANALANKDHKTLRNERDKLPEDSSGKHPDGSRNTHKPARPNKFSTGWEFPVNPSSIVTSKRPIADTTQIRKSRELNARWNKVAKQDANNTSGGASLNNFLNQNAAYRYQAKGKETVKPDGTSYKVDDKRNTYYSNGRMRDVNGNMRNINSLSLRNAQGFTPTTPSSNSNWGVAYGLDKPSNNAQSKPLQAPQKPKTNIHTQAKRKSSVAPKNSVKQAAIPMPILQPFKAGTSEQDISALKGSYSPDQIARNNAANFIGPPKPNNLDTTSPQLPTAKIDDKSNTKQKGQGLNNALQFAGVANNLFQGMKNEPELQQNYITPDLLKYSDRSQGLRNQSNSTLAMQNANTRNLSGGNAGNLRSNMQASNAANMSRQSEIDEREQGRADAIDQTNTGIKNQAAEANAQRRDNYQQIMMGNRAAKEAFIGQAASDIGRIGNARAQEAYIRSRDDKAEAAQLAGLNAMNDGGNNRNLFDIKGNRTYNPLGGSSIVLGGGYNLRGKGKPALGLTPYGNLGKTKNDDKSAYEEQAKGNKGVKLSKYKMKKDAKHI